MSRKIKNAQSKIPTAIANAPTNVMTKCEKDSMPSDGLQI
jgi:hypothetical protein